MSLLTAQLVPLLVILLIGCFAVLVLVVRQYLNRGLIMAMGRLQAQHEENERLRRQMAAKIAEVQQHAKDQVAQAKAEADALKTKAAQDSEQQHRAAIEQAREEGERILQQAKKAREALIKEVEQTIERRAVDRACDLVQQVLTGDVQAAAHAHWVGKLLGNGLIGAAQLATQEDVREAHVVTACPLTPAQRQHLQNHVHQALGHDVTWREDVDPRLIAGLRVELGHLVLDGSFASKLHDIARQTQDRAASDE